MLSIGQCDDHDANHATERRRPNGRKDILKALEAIFRARAAGVILTNYSPLDSWRNVVRAAVSARVHFPSQWIGVNFQDHALSTIKRLPKCASGFWANDSGVNATAQYPTVAASFAKDELLTKERPDALYFGGVLQLYGSTAPHDPLKAAVLAKDFVDVVAWGTPYIPFPSLKEVERVRELIGSHPLAVCGRLEDRPDLLQADKILGSVDVLLPAINLSMNPERMASMISTLVTMTHDHMNAKERPWVREWWQSEKGVHTSCTP